MKPDFMRLLISTPIKIIVDSAEIRSFRAADSSGDFGVQPGHVDLLTVLPSGVVRWRGESGPWHFCGLRGGVLTVEDGQLIKIACRSATVSDDLASLEDDIRQQRHEDSNEARKARIAQTRLHAQAIRQIMHHISDGTTSAENLLEGIFQ